MAPFARLPPEIISSILRSFSNVTKEDRKVLESYCLLSTDWMLEVRTLLWQSMTAPTTKAKLNDLKRFPAGRTYSKVRKLTIPSLVTTDFFPWLDSQLDHFALVSEIVFSGVWFYEPLPELPGPPSSIPDPSLLTVSEIDTIHRVFGKGVKTLRFIPYTRFPVGSRFHDFLHGFPELQTLDVRERYIVDTFRSIPLDTTSYPPLEALETVWIQDTAVSWLRFLLPVPNLRRLSGGLLGPWGITQQVQDLIESSNIGGGIRELELWRRNDRKREIDPEEEEMAHGMATSLATLLNMMPNLEVFETSSTGLGFKLLRYVLNQPESPTLMSLKAIRIPLREFPVDDAEALDALFRERLPNLTSLTFRLNVEQDPVEESVELVEGPESYYRIRSADSDRGVWSQFEDQLSELRGLMPWFRDQGKLNPVYFLNDVRCYLVD